METKLGTKYDYGWVHMEVSAFCADKISQLHYLMEHLSSKLCLKLINALRMATQITLLTDPLFWQVYDVTTPITSIIQHAYLGSKN